MYVIVPQCDVPSLEKRDRLLEFISKVALVTHEQEHGCEAYAWFRNAEDTATVPHQWVRGLEVYATPEDNRETHRASEAYQNFRAAAVSEELLNGYPDVRFWRPTGVGYLTQAPAHLETQQDTAHNYIVIQDLSPKDGDKAQVLEILRPVAKLAADSGNIGSFWVLERDNEEDGSDLILFSAYKQKDDYEVFSSTKAAGVWKRIEELCNKAVTTTWSHSSIGFLGR